MPKGKKHTPEQIVAILRGVEGGETIAAVCREVNFSEATFHRWKQQYGALDLDEVVSTIDSTASRQGRVFMPACVPAK